MVSLASLRTVLSASVLFLMLGSISANAGSACGGASWYALRSKTASGERMNPSDLTAAHRTLPFGSKVKVTNQRNGRSIVVRINDRGPFVKGRVIDVSKGAANRLGFTGAGHTDICMARL